MTAGEHRLYHLAAANPVSWYAFAQTIIEMASKMPGFVFRLEAEAIKAIALLPMTWACLREVT